MRTKVQFYSPILAILTVFVFPTISRTVPLLYVSGYQRAAEIEGNTLLPHNWKRDTPQTSITVDTLADELNSDGDCSLREAISAANNNNPTDKCPAGDVSNTDTITFAITGIITLGSQLIVDAGGPLVIDGGSGITISGGDSVRIFYVNGGANLTLEGLSLIDGFASEGGGIYNFGTLTVKHSTLSGSTSSIFGGGIRNGGTLTVSQSTIAGNTSGNRGGAIENFGTLVVTNSTISGNSATLYGGGIYNDAQLKISSSTISANHAQVGGGVYGTGGGLSLKNTLLAANSATTNAPDCFALSATTAGYNLVGNKGGCGFTPTTGDLTGVNPNIGPLQDNNGSTHTHALLPGSLALNGGDPGGCTDHLSNPLATDQRGFPRNGRCDIGAYEWQSVPSGPHELYLPMLSRSCGLIPYHDDFSNPNSDWPNQQDQNVRYEYLGGEYRILVINRLFWAAASPGFQASEYVAVVDVRNVNNIPGSYGVIFGLSNDWTQLYSFEISPSGEYWLLRKESTSWELLATGNTSFIHPGSDSNQLKVERKGGQIWTSVNGQLLNILEDNYYTGLRAFGLVAAAFNQPDVDIRFDNFALYPSTCGSASTSLNQVFGGDDINMIGFSPTSYWIRHSFDR